MHGQAAHIQPDLTVGGDVGPEQRGQTAFALSCQPPRPCVAGKDVLDHKGVDAGQGGLPDAQAQHKQG